MNPCAQKSEFDFVYSDEKYAGIFGEYEPCSKYYVQNYLKFPGLEGKCRLFLRKKKNIWQQWENSQAVKTWQRNIQGLYF